VVFTACSSSGDSGGSDNGGGGGQTVSGIVILPSGYTAEVFVDANGNGVPISLYIPDGEDDDSQW
jgi:hypothetical protein